MKTNKLLQSFFVFAALLLLLAFDQWIFQAFGGDYLQWYLDSGAFIGLGTALFTITWGREIDKNIGLISPHPRAYVAAYMRLVALLMKVMGGQGKAISHQLAERFGELRKRILE